MKKLRRLILIVVASAGLAAHASGPNVLFLISDDLSAEALACYGNAQCKTPNIDRLAARGIAFDRAYCQYPICGPSRAALMSGMYPESIGVMGNGGANNFTELLGGRPSMAQHFKNNGYYAGRVGKIYHMRVPGDITAGVSGPDHAASWTEFFDCPGREWMTKGPYQHLSNEKLDRDPDKHYGLGFGTAFYVVRADDDGEKQPDVKAADKAIDLLQQNGAQPFFLAVGFLRPHVPLVAPANYFDPYTGAAMTLPETMPDDLADVPEIGIYKSAKSMGFAGDDANAKNILAAYYASVAFMDAQVGRILDELARLGLDENTIVVFTSDHGFHLGEHDLWQKVSLHEESARIPLVFAGPGIPVGRRDALAQQIDIYPTLAELAGLPVPVHVQGKSLEGALASEDAAPHEAVFSCNSDGTLIRTPDWAYIEYRDGSKELYDMKNDPGQFTNLANAQAHEETQVGLATALHAHLARIR